MTFLGPPRLGFWKIVVETGGVLAAGQGVEEENRIVFSSVEFSVGFIREIDMS